MSVGPLDSVIWDEENEAHIAEHDLTIEEVEEVLRSPESSQSISDTTGMPASFGWTTTGRHIIVIWDELNDDPRMVRPITAYDVPPPAR